MTRSEHREVPRCGETTNCLQRQVVLCFATAGRDTGDEGRITALLGEFDAHLYRFDRRRKALNIPRLLRLVRKLRPALVVMEGTGIAGGVSVLLSRRLFGVPYVVSSGDAIGPFVGAAHGGAGSPAWVYEYFLYRQSAGFIGWTPYLVGRALTMGAPRAITAANYAPWPGVRETRAFVRDRLGIPEDAIVFGIVGSLAWNQRYRYCYGMELVDAIRQVERRDVAVLIVGDGTGRDHLAARAGQELGRRVFLAGHVSRELVTTYLAAMDVGSLPQSVNQVGSFRYTTKLPEYQSARLPIVTGEIPVAYDLAYEWSWRLAGESPWADEYIASLVALMERLDHVEIAAMSANVPQHVDAFDEVAQRRRVGTFVRDILRHQDQVSTLR